MKLYVILFFAIAILLILKTIILYNLKSSEHNQKGYFNIIPYININELFNKRINQSKYNGKELYMAKMYNHYTNIIYILVIVTIITIFLS